MWPSLGTQKQKFVVLWEEILGGRSDDQVSIFLWSKVKGVKAKRGTYY